MIQIPKEINENTLLPKDLHSPKFQKMMSETSPDPSSLRSEVPVCLVNEKKTTAVSLFLQ